MIKRRLQGYIEHLLQHNPAVALLGPRQAGKTTLALTIGARLSSIYLDLESDSDKVKLDNPELYLSSHTDKLIILNEIQRIPELFQNLRGIIDKGRREGKGNSRFFLLGSASVDLLKQSGESLAGRISFVELGPFNILEFQDDLDLLWCRGGLSK